MFSSTTTISGPIYAEQSGITWRNLLWPQADCVLHLSRVHNARLSTRTVLGSSKVTERTLLNEQSQRTSTHRNLETFPHYIISPLIHPQKRDKNIPQHLDRGIKKKKVFNASDDHKSMFPELECSPSAVVVVVAVVFP